MKGQEWIGGLFSLLLAGIIAGVALPAILPGQVLKVTPEAEANEFENKAITLANSLLSNQNLVYFDGVAYHRGVLDQSKLDAVEKDPSSIEFLPGTYTRIYVEDRELGKVWTFELVDGESKNIKIFLNCKIQPEITDFITECAPNRYSSILDKGFPVTIKSSDGFHTGFLKLTVVE